MKNSKQIILISQTACRPNQTVFYKIWGRSGWNHSVLRQPTNEVKAPGSPVAVVKAADQHHYLSVAVLYNSPFLSHLASINEPVITWTKDGMKGGAGCVCNPFAATLLHSVSRIRSNPGKWEIVILGHFWKSKYYFVRQLEL